MQLATPTGRDRQHLKILRICHYVWGTVVAISVLFFVIASYLTVMNEQGGGAPAIVLTVMALAFLLFGLGIAALNVWSADNLGEMKNRKLSLTVAGLNCCSFPLGTALGIATFVVLLRPSVAAAYAQSRALGAAS